MFDEPTTANYSSSEVSPWTHVQFDTSIVSVNVVNRVIGDRVRNESTSARIHTAQQDDVDF
jgi:hypothetical protein